MAAMVSFNACLEHVYGIFKAWSKTIWFESEENKNIPIAIPQ